MKSILDNLDVDLKSSLKCRLRDVWTHSSTAIEGNSLTLEETAFVLRDGSTIKGKPLKDHNEVTGHAAAIGKIYELLGKETVAESDLFDLHRCVMTGAPMDIHSPVGEYKVEDNYTQRLGGGVKKYPPPERIPSLVERFLVEFNKSSPVSRAAAVAAYSRYHLLLTEIHPFADGNGRMARLIANIPVLRAGFPPITIAVEDRKEYIETLQRYDLEQGGVLELRGDPAEFTRFVERQWRQTLEILDEIMELQEERNMRRSINMDV